MVNSSRKLGETIGKMNQEQTDIKSNISANEQDANAVIKSTENLFVVGTLTATKKVYASDSFVVDHPVQGELDSSVYKLDGGYDNTQEEILVNKSF